MILVRTRVVAGLVLSVSLQGPRLSNLALPSAVVHGCEALLVDGLTSGLELFAVAHPANVLVGHDNKQEDCESITS